MGLRVGVAGEGSSERSPSLSAASLNAPFDCASWNSGLATSFTAQLAIHTKVRPRHCFETRIRNGAARGDATAVTAVLHSSKCGIDLFHEVPGRRRKNEITFAFHCDRVAVPGFLIELGITLVAFADEQVGFGLEFFCLVQVPNALFFEQAFQAGKLLVGQFRLVELHNQT